MKVADVLADAKAAGLDVYDYLEDLLALSSSAAAAIGELDRLGGLRDGRTVVEIGPGSGAYLREMLAWARISQIFIYETAEDWRTWLQRHYPVDAKPTTGHSSTTVPTITRRSWLHTASSSMLMCSTPTNTSSR